MIRTIQFDTYMVSLFFNEDHIFVSLCDKFSNQKYEVKISDLKEYCQGKDIILESFFKILCGCFNKENGHIVILNVYNDKIIANFNISLYEIFNFDFDIVFNCLIVDNYLKEDIQKLKDENEYIMMSNQNLKEEIKNLRKQIDECINKLSDLSVNMLDNVLIGSRFGSPVFTHKNKQADLIGKIGYSGDLYIDCVRVLRFPVNIDFDIINKNNISIYIDGEKIYNEKEGMNDKKIIIDFLNEK
jgi:cell division protein FtsB